MPYKIVVFDLDQTLVNETLCHDTENVLKILKKSGYHLSIASFNKHATWFCDRYNISQYFDLICCDVMRTKVNHINKILNYYNTNNIKCTEKEIVFFDDKKKNFVHLGAKCCLVNKRTGIKLDDVSWLL